MPQMMPINWIISFIMFILIFIMFNILNYYIINFNKIIKNKNIINYSSSFTPKKYFTWKW